MPTVSRRTQTSSNPLEEARRNRPKRTPRNTPDYQQNLGEHVSFQAKNKVEKLVLKLALLPEGVDSKDDSLTEKAITAIGGRYLHFSDGFYRTANKDVIAWLRHRLRTGKLRSVKEIIPQPTVVGLGDDAVVLNHKGERLMTMEEAISLQDQIAAHEAANAPAERLSPAERAERELARLAGETEPAAEPEPEPAKNPARVGTVTRPSAKKGS